MRRPHRLTFRVSERELNIIQNKAQDANITVSEYLRHTSLNYNITVIDGLDEFNKELRSIGRNLNQLTRLCNQGRITCLELNYVRNGIARMVKKVNQLGE